MSIKTSKSLTIIKAKIDHDEQSKAQFRMTLVIPVRNEEESLSNLLASITQQIYSPSEVVMVDGGSTDRTVALARELTAGDPRFRLIEAGDATPGRGRNVGIDAAANEWIALTDAGIRLEPTWLQELVAVAKADPNVDVVYGHYEPVIRNVFDQSAALTYVPPRQMRPGGDLTRGPSTASMLIKRDVWSNVGGIPDARAAEDLIFFERIEKAGFKVGWAPGAVVHWQMAPTLSKTFRRFALYSKHNVWVGRQRYWHYGVARQYLVAVLAIVLAFALSPWCLLLIPAWLAARVAKSLWVRRRDAAARVLLNPLVWVGVLVIMLTIDLATFVGWGRALMGRPPRSADTSPRQTAGTPA